MSNLKQQLEQAVKELSKFQWNPISARLPTVDDANDYHDVEWSDGENIWQNQFTNPNIKNRKATHWRRIVLP